MSLLGATEPRIWTPPLRELTPETTFGFEAIEFARDVLGMELYPWQEWALIHGLEVHPNYTTADKRALPRFDVVLILAARQNGKTEDAKPLALWKIYVDQRGGVVIGTSQDLAAAHKTWSEAVDIVETTEDLAELVASIDKTNGRQTLKTVDGGQYMIRAASRRGARSFTGDLVLLDELREHLTWEPWAAATKTTMARPRSQVWGFSNAGDVRSVVLKALRLVAMSGAVGVEPGELEAFRGPIDEGQAPEEDPEAPDDVGSIGIFEWSAKPGASIWDRQAWAQSNPSMGHGDGVGLTERKVSAAAKTDPEWVFRTEVMCQWPTGVVAGVFPPGAWDAVQDPDSRPVEGSPRVFSVDVTPDQSWAAIGAAALREDGLAHLQVVDHHRGDGWVVERIVQLRARWGSHGPVVLCGRMAAALKTDLLRKVRDAEDLDDGVPDEQIVLVMSTRDVIAGTSDFYRSVTGTPEHEEDGVVVPASPPNVRLMQQQAVTEAVEGAEWKDLPDGRIFARRGSADVCPLYAVIGALFGLRQWDGPDDAMPDSYF